MTTEQKNKIQQQIQHELSELETQITQLSAKLQPIAPDCSLGRLTRMEAMNEQEVSQRILDETLLRQTRLRNALSRIDHAMFGICIECEEAIGLERMKIRPESVRCVDCANGH
jgi:DnaK suppressor protein